ncbi:MAG: carboxypeptidase regulatory-like domain-containing protein [Blastocatellia bacterium]|nr:carboxypeptidase regulatory-like domain-containing protein [Blastocatellia bacterium]
MLTYIHLPSEASRFLLFFSLFLLLTASSLAQITRGSLSGSVTDPTGAVLSNADVTLKNPANGEELKTISNAEGEFVFPSLAIGNYALTVEAGGFKRFVIQSVVIEVAATARLAVALSVGEINEAITVSNVQELVNTSSPTLNNVVERRQIVDLPLSSRNPIELVRLQAGVTGTGTGATNAAGLRGATSNVTRDGINVMDNFVKTANFGALTAPTVEATGEFSVSVGTVSSDAGRGVAQVRIVTPSGTNQFHGGLFWYHRNSVLNANSFINNSTNTARPFSLQNRVGFMANGPVHLPKSIFGPLSYDGRNRSFWFLSYEAFRQPFTVIRTRTVLTPEARAGNFRYVGANGQMQNVNIFNIGNVKVANPVMKPIIDLTPLPNNSLVGDGLNTAGFNFGAKAMSIVDRWSSRFDQVLAEQSRLGSHRLEFVFHRTPSSLTPDTGNAIDAPFPGGINGVNNIQATATAAAIHSTFGQHVSNEVRVGHQRTPYFFGPEKPPEVSFFVSTLLVTNPINNVLYNTRNTTVYQVQDNLSWVKGAHTLRFGLETQSITYHNFSSSGTYPSVNLGTNPANPDGILNTNFPSLPAGAAGQTIANRARSLYALLVGNLANASQTFNVTSPSSGFVPYAGSQYPIQQREINLYAMDRWRVRRNLTINVGVRWEWLGVPKMLNGLTLQPVNGIAGLYGISGEGNLFQPGVLKGTAPTLLDFAGADKGRPIYNDDWNNFAPYFGFGFSPGSDKGWRNKLFGGEGKSSIRGGYSISYLRDGLSVHRAALVSNPGLTATIVNTAPRGVLTAAGVPVAVPTFKTPISDAENFQRNNFSSINAYDPKLRTPYVQQWSFGIERELVGKIAVEVRYVGNRAVKLYRAYDINEGNIFENGFLQEFLNAQKNLTANRGASFAPGATGTVPLPIFSTLFAGLSNAVGFANTTFINYLTQNRVGDTAFSIRTSPIYQTNLARLAPNFFAANQNVNQAVLIGNGAFSNYHSLQVELRRRFSNGLLLQAAYTFSKAITDTEGSTNNFEPFRTIRNLRLDRHRADYDQPHTFVGNYIYELPIGPGRRFANGGPAVIRKALEGWQTQGIVSWHSGFPTFALSGRTTFNDYSTLNPAQLTGITFADFKKNSGVFKTPQGVFFINPNLLNITTAANGTLQAASLKDGLLGSPPPGQFGNFPRNAMNSPSFFQMDFGVLKRTKLKERANIEFRAEFFNLFNNVNFGSGTLSFDSQRFGQITGTFASRFGQLALRVNW